VTTCSPHDDVSVIFEKGAEVPQTALDRACCNTILFEKIGAIENSVFGE
jgi:hypothetical protein